MDEDIEQAKYIIKRQVDIKKISFFGEPFSKHQRVYAFTNENIKGYMSQIDFSNKRNALTVLASGDHVYNLIHYGIVDIDTFDSNALTRYYALGIKKALIERDDYQDFLDDINKLINSQDIEEVTTLMFDIINYMDNDNKKYWSSITQYNYKIQKRKGISLNLLKMLLINTREGFLNIYRNKYLEDEKSYQLMKDNLGRARITFSNENFYTLENTFDNKYDLILLSNILDYLCGMLNTYWGMDKLLEVISYIEKFMNVDGEMLLSYFYSFYNDKKNTYNNHPFAGSNVTMNDLRDERILKFPSFRNDMMDGLLIKKKR